MCVFPKDENPVSSRSFSGVRRSLHMLRTLRKTRGSRRLKKKITKIRSKTRQRNKERDSNRLRQLLLQRKGVCTRAREFHYGFKQQTSRVHAKGRLQVFLLQLVAMKFTRLYRAVVQNFYAGVNGAFRCQSLRCWRSWRVLRLRSLNCGLVPFDALFVEFGDKLLISSRRAESAIRSVDSGRRRSWYKRQQKTAQLCGIEALVLFRGVHGGERGFVLFAPFRWNMRRSDAPRCGIGLLLRR
jgi:hypothetical protein